MLVEKAAKYGSVIDLLHGRIRLNAVLILRQDENFCWTEGALHVHLIMRQDGASIQKYAIILIKAANTD